MRWLWEASAGRGWVVLGLRVALNLQHGLEYSCPVMLIAWYTFKRILGKTGRLGSSSMEEAGKCWSRRRMKRWERLTTQPAPLCKLRQHLLCTTISTNWETS